MSRIAFFSLIFLFSSIKSNPDRVFGQLLTSCSRYPDAYNLLLHPEVSGRRRELSLFQAAFFSRGLDFASRAKQNASLATQGAVFGVLFGHMEGILFGQKEVGVDLQRLFGLLPVLEEYSVFQTLFYATLGIFSNFRKLGPILTPELLVQAVEKVHPLKNLGLGLASKGMCGAVVALAMSLEERFLFIDSSTLARFLNSFESFDKQDDFVAAFVITGNLVNHAGIDVLKSDPAELYSLMGKGAGFYEWKRQGVDWITKMNFELGKAFSRLTALDDLFE